MSLLFLPAHYGFNSFAAPGGGGSAVTWDPATGHKGSRVTLSNGNLTAQMNTGTGWYQWAVLTTPYIAYTDTPRYAEITVNTFSDDGGIIDYLNIGVIQSPGAFGPPDSGSIGSTFFPQYGKKSNNGSTWQNYGSSLAAGSIIGVYYEPNIWNGSVWTGRITFYGNGTSYGAAHSGFDSQSYPFALCVGLNGGSSVSDKVTANAGATAFTYTPPSGCKSWDGSQTF